MTLRELIEILDANPGWTLAGLVAVPVLAWLLGWLHPSSRGELRPWSVLYSVLVHLSAIPGLLALVMTAYALFFTRESLFDLSLVVFLVPIVTFVLTLVIVAQRVRFERLPGLDRLFASMSLLGVSFVIVLLLSRVRVWVLFGGSMVALLVFTLALYALLRWSYLRTTRP